MSTEGSPQPGQQSARVRKKKTRLRALRLILAWLLVFVGVASLTCKLTYELPVFVGCLSLAVGLSAWDQRRVFRLVLTFLLVFVGVAELTALNLSPFTNCLVFIGCLSVALGLSVWGLRDPGIPLVRRQLWGLTAIALLAWIGLVVAHLPGAHEQQSDWERSDTFRYVAEWIDKKGTHDEAKKRLTAKGAQVHERRLDRSEVILDDPRISDDDLDELANLLHVRNLRLGPGIRNDGLAKCIKLCPDLEILDLSPATGITADGLGRLKDLQKLTQVRLSKPLESSGGETLRGLGFKVAPDGAYVKQ